MGELESTPESTRAQTLSPRRRSESCCRDVDAPEPMAPRRRRPPPTEQVIRHAGGSIRQIWCAKCASPNKPPHVVGAWWRRLSTSLWNLPRQCYSTTFPHTPPPCGEQKRRRAV